MPVRKRGKRWYVDFMIKRQRIRFCVPEARTKQQAERVEVEAREAIYLGKYGGLRPPVFATYVEKVYLPHAKDHKRSYDDDVDRCNVLCQEFGKLTLDQIQPFRVEQWKRARLATPTKHGGKRAPGSVNLELSCLKRILQYAVEQGSLSENQLRKVKLFPEPPARTRFLTPDEEARLLAALTGKLAYLKPIVLLAIHTGMRRQEIYLLRWEQIDFGKHALTLTRTKTNRPRTVPLNSVAWSVIEECARVRDGNWLFPSVCKQDAPRVYQFADWKAACVKAGLVDFRFHDLRHTAATRWNESGADAFAIRDLLGHTRLNQTSGYTHVHAERLAETVERAAQSENDCRKIVSIATERAARRA